MHKRFTVLMVCLMLATAFTGCGNKKEALVEHAASVSGIPEAYMIEEDNYFDYQPGLECSAFASAYLLRHYGVEATGLELFQDFPDKVPDGSGVYPQGIVTFFSDLGYQAEFVYDATVEELKEEVAKGAPVIVFIHVGDPEVNVHYTHYVPIVGYDETYFYFAESLDYMANCKDEEDLPYNRKTEIKDFQKIWANIEGYWDYPYFSIAPKGEE